MVSFPGMMDNAVGEWMEGEGYFLHEIQGPAHIYRHHREPRLVIVDRGICQADRMPYSEYTHLQNRLMHGHDRLYRFVVDTEEELREARKEFSLLAGREAGDEVDIETPGHTGDRGEYSIDPSPLEAHFEEAFIDIYGRESLDRVLREASFPDIYGRERYFDYLVEVKKSGEPGAGAYWIAIEQNGEQYHHPAVVGKTRYRSQLLKQNSFVSWGNKLYRWSFGGMIDRDNFIQDIRRYLGEGKDFLTTSFIKAGRRFTLFQHQDSVLEDIRRARESGQNSFLVVLPTGTGKTQILMEDLHRLHRERGDGAFRTLILVPTRAILRQTEEKLASSGLFSPRRLKEIRVSTYQGMIFRYRDFPPDHFDYVAVDEAHHAAAPSLKRVVQYFTPSSLLGMTATDKRLDMKRLEDIFGSYDTRLSLKEAILQGILAPIRAFRVQSSLDLSRIRYNGRDYTQSDLQRHVFIESRDQLVTDIVKKYFARGRLEKQGLVFCVSVRHAESLAARLTRAGIPAASVSGRDRKSEDYMEAYRRKEIQFLTSCSLIHEGWDSPQTSVIVMARPTMSKALYTQQIGRGTRRHPGKEALYIIDVVDNYDALKSPWNIHALTGSVYYKPWADIFAAEAPVSYGREELVLAGFYEKERKIEKISIFTFEKEYGDYLSTEQLARELFISTGTVKNWIRKGGLTPDVVIPFGRSRLEYFHPDRVDEIRRERGLGMHDETTIYQDFYEFLEKGDYTFSYKIVFLLSLLVLADRDGNCPLDSLTELYRSFYRDRLTAGKPVDRELCPYTPRLLADSAAVQRSILANPFEKFERKRFMFHVKTGKKDRDENPLHRDLNSISFSHALWEKIGTPDEKKRIRDMMLRDLENYYRDLGGLTDFSFTARYEGMMDEEKRAGFLAADGGGGDGM